MAKYIVIRKDSGKIYAPHLHDDTSFPINPQELEYVQITPELESALDVHDKVIDYNNTSFNNGTWTVVFITPQKVDIFERRNNDKNQLLAEAARKLSISDMPDDFKAVINSYIDELNAIVITRNEIQQIQWPEKPW